MPIGFLLLVAAVILILLNPFNGAALIGAIVAGLTLLFSLVSAIIIAFVWKGISSDRDRLKF